MGTLEEIAESVIMGRADKVREMVQVALDSGITVKEILNRGFIAAMAVLGERFQKNEVYVPELLIAARAMKVGMLILEPLLLQAKVEPIGKVVIGTVKGDVHDIGKNLLGIMLKGAGFEVDDLGVDVPPEKFVSAAQDERVRIVCMSALLTTAVPFMRSTIEALKAAGLMGRVKTMVGGATVTKEYADRIGANGYAPNAVAAVDKAKEILGLT